MFAMVILATMYTHAEPLRRYAQAADGGEPPPKARAEKEQRRGWLRHLFGWK